MLWQKADNNNGGKGKMENIIIREATVDDAEEMISYLNIVGGESDNLMHGSPRQQRKIRTAIS